MRSRFLAYSICILTHLTPIVRHSPPTTSNAFNDHYGPDTIHRHHHGRDRLGPRQPPPCSPLRVHSRGPLSRWPPGEPDPPPSTEAPGAAPTVPALHTHRGPRESPIALRCHGGALSPRHPLDERQGLGRDGDGRDHGGGAGTQAAGLCQVRLYEFLAHGPVHAGAAPQIRLHLSRLRPAHGLPLRRPDVPIHRLSGFSRSQGSAAHRGSSPDLRARQAGGVIVERPANSRR